MSTATSALSFLTSGSANPYVTTGSQSSSQLPDWYNNYANQILSSAASYANQGAPIFPGPQVAGQTADTAASYGQIRNLAGTYGGLANQAAGAAGTATNTALNGGALNAAAPNLNQAASTINGAVGSIPGQISNYMSPYLSGVTGAMATAANQNMVENQLPALQAAFTASGGGGHYGNDTTGSAGNTAEATQEQILARNSQSALSNAQAGALNTGYGQALQGAETGAGQALQAGSALGALGSAAGQLSATDTGQALSGATNLANIGATGTSTGLAQAGALNSAGQQQQGQNQANLDAAKSNYYTQFNWPLTGANAMESTLQGIQAPALTQNYQSGPLAANNYNPNPLGTTANALSSLGPLSNLINGSGGNPVSSLSSYNPSNNYTPAQPITADYSTNLGGPQIDTSGYQMPDLSAYTSPFQRGGHARKARLADKYAP